MTRLPLAASVVALAFASPAVAGSIQADHNGSTMKLAADGADLVISYQRPRDGLRKAGFKPGTVLAEVAIEDDGRLVGYARAFSSKCGWKSYAVVGAMHTASGLVELRAPSGGPRWDGGCRVRLTTDSPHTELLFEAEPAALAGIDPAAARARTGSEMSAVFEQPAAVDAAPDWEIRSDTAGHKTAEPVAETVSRNAAPPLATGGQTPEQLEEAVTEAALYSDPEFREEADAINQGTETIPSPTPPSAEPVEAAPAPTLEPPRKKLTLDF